MFTYDIILWEPFDFLHPSKQVLKKFGIWLHKHAFLSSKFTLHTGCKRIGFEILYEFSLYKYRACRQVEYVLTRRTFALGRPTFSSLYIRSFFRFQLIRRTIPTKNSVFCNQAIMLTNGPWPRVGLHQCKRMTSLLWCHGTFNSGKSNPCL